MVDIKGVAHFSIPVSDLEKSTAFYRDIVGCRHLATTPNGKLSFLDAGGVCVILGKHDAPINPVLDDHEGVHHSFMVDSDAEEEKYPHLSAPPSPREMQGSRKLQPVPALDLTIRDFIRDDGSTSLLPLFAGKMKASPGL